MGEYCQIAHFNGSERSGGHTRALEIGNQKYICPNGMKPLVQWVKLGYRHVIEGAAPWPINTLCLDCYKNIFKGYPLPSESGTGQHDRLMTEQVAEEEYARAAQNYMPDPELEQGIQRFRQVAEQPLAVPKAPQKPPLLRLGAGFFRTRK